MGTNGTVYKRPPPRFDNLSKLIIPVLLLGVYALWMHDRSSRVARAASQAQTLALTDIDKPYVHFQQLQSEETSSIETGEGSRARPLDQNRKIVGGRDTVSQAGTLPNISLAALPDGVGKTGEVAVPKQAGVSAADLALQQLSGQVPLGTMAQFDETVKRLKEAQDLAKSRVAKGVDSQADPKDVLLDDEDTKQPKSELAKRQAAVKAAMRHSWNGYVQYAWGADELLPLSRRGGTAFCNTGATLLDALGTLWIMGMRKEFGRARDWVADQMSIDMNCQTSLFELVIRAVGGLLSAYDLSGDEVFLTKAQAIAERMMPAFDTPTGIPRGTINLGTQASAATSWAGGANGAVLSELGSVQMEFIHLSRLTGEPKYGAAAERVIKFLNAKFDQGLLPVYINLETGAATSAQFAMGALSDSYYEYLLKVWVLKGRTDEMYRAMWVRAMDEMLERLVGTSSDGLQYVGDLNGGSFVQRLEHLTCFVAGNLALGVHTGAVNGTRADKYMALARNLTNTCYEMYRRMPTGLGPEQVTFQTGIMSKVTGYNILRPEVVESIFMLYRTTNDTLYRDMGWSIFQAFETYSKVDSGGYSGVVDVGIVPPTKDDKMQSFWLAETLKYLYLLFSPSSIIPLSDWVFNTEAHPFRLGVPAATSLTNGTAAAVVGSLS